MPSASHRYLAHPSSLAASATGSLHALEHCIVLAVVLVAVSAPRYRVLAAAAALAAAGALPRGGVVAAAVLLPGLSWAEAGMAMAAIAALCAVPGWAEALLQAWLHPTVAQWLTTGSLATAHLPHTFTADLHAYAVQLVLPGLELVKRTTLALAPLFPVLLPWGLRGLDATSTALATTSAAAALAAHGCAADWALAMGLLACCPHLACRSQPALLWLHGASTAAQPLMRWMWLVRGTGNVNFLFFQGMIMHVSGTLSAAQAVAWAVTDAWASSLSPTAPAAAAGGAVPPQPPAGGDAAAHS